MDKTKAETLAHRWAAAWGGPEPSAWIALYAPNATYIDHAFQIRRAGAATLRLHWHKWRTAIPDFEMEVERFEPGRDERHFSTRTINRGTFEKDLPSKKASGKRFSFTGVVDFRVDGEGRIEYVEEWYTWDFGEGRDVKDYHFLGDGGS